MTIETKYNPYQTVWAMVNNKPIKREIDGIKIHAYYRGGVTNGRTGNIADIRYVLNATEGTFAESELFPSKQDLLNSL